jgi:hypothetical protein
LHKEGFVDVFDCGRFFADGGGEGFDADWSATEHADDGRKQPAIGFVETAMIDLKHGKGLIGDCLGDDAVGSDLGIVADPFEEAVGHPRGAAGAASYFLRATGVDCNVQYFRGPVYNAFEVLLFVVFQAADDTETIAQRARSGRRPELWRPRG